MFITKPLKYVKYNLNQMLKPHEFLSGRAQMTFIILQRKYDEIENSG